MEITKQVENLYLEQSLKKSIQLICGEKKKRQRGYDPIIPASKPAGHAELQEERVPKSAKQVLPIGIFVATVIGVVDGGELIFLF